jgi:hypothetical protein
MIKYNKFKNIITIYKKNKRRADELRINIGNKINNKPKYSSKFHIVFIRILLIILVIFMKNINLNEVIIDPSDPD